MITEIRSALSGRQDGTSFGLGLFQSDFPVLREGVLAIRPSKSRKTMLVSEDRASSFARRCLALCRVCRIFTDDSLVMSCFSHAMLFPSRYWRSLVP